jgi:hypothetical protein
MLRLTLITSALILFGWATSSSAQVKGDLYQCQTIDAQMLRGDGKLQRNDWTKTEIKKFKNMVYDAASGILRFNKVDAQLFGKDDSGWGPKGPKKKAHPPIKLKVVKSEGSGTDIVGILSADGSKKATFQKYLTSVNKPMVRVFYIDRDRISVDDDKNYKGEPFYFLNNNIIYTGFCNLFDEFTNAPSPNK